ncbi:GUN4 domain-containing protein [Nostoc sp. 'Peltigera membranacea cyanobiont' N6]|uniref:GUN4 domain-containing protein n=1 Tax=Nostoc sp. 'Peltigera membranacea cyanobiont' N6 TaxID=1261031 RepID=UPI000CF32F22|nr:GUN4 domain-containing protein [Nostoc sp. 'Peltigera membranacea cyanobiont' N6]AVH64190.1 GUN4 domain-containing protein [Nostoc sp. 'Peltigera membranacea cyanobiont' N6]
MAQPEPNILQLAKQGNPKAIATIINRQLEPKGIIAQVDLKDNCLQILIEAIQLPPQHIIVEYFRKSFTNLDATAIKTIKVYAKRPGEVFFDWHELFDLVEAPGQELLKMAKSGDIQSITIVINQCLKNQGIIAKVNLKDSCLRVMLEAQEAINQELIVPILINQLEKLTIESINKLIVYGKQTNEEFPGWHQEINYNLLTNNSEKTVESLALVSIKETEAKDIINVSLSQIENIDSVKLSNYLYYEFLQNRIYEPLSVRFKAEEEENKIHGIVNAFNISTLQEDIKLSIRQIEKQIVRTLEDKFCITLDINQVERIFYDISNYRFSNLKNAIKQMETAIQEVLNFNFPEETNELKAFFKGAVEGAVDGLTGRIKFTEVIVGGVIGNLIIPGLGGVIGGAVGGWFAGNKEQKRMEEIINKYDIAKTKLNEEFKILFQNCYEDISKLINSLYKINLIKYQYLIQAEELNRQGIESKNIKNLIEAIHCYDKAISLNPHYYGAWCNKGWALVLLGKYEEAIHAFDESLKINSELIMPLESKIMLLGYRLEQHETVLLLCNNAISKGYNTFNILSAKSFSLYKLERYQEAIEICDIAISIYSSSLEIYQFFIQKAACMIWMEDSELALENLKEAITLNPEKSQEIIKVSPSFENLKNDERFIALMESSVGVDYSNLNKLLAENKWKEADIETAKLMCLAVTNHDKRLNIIVKDARAYTELNNERIVKIPAIDLNTIDKLWLNCSKGKFGFSVQKEIYQNLGGTKEFNGEIRDKFGVSVGWRTRNNNGNYFWRNSDDCHYYIDIDIALRGHLPSCLWAGINDDWFENRRERLITLFYHLQANGIGNISKQ